MTSPNNESKIKKIREAVAQWFFENTDFAYWDLCGHALENSITTYGLLVNPPQEEFDLSDDDMGVLKRIHERLLTNADDLLSELSKLGVVVLDDEQTPPENPYEMKLEFRELDLGESVAQGAVNSAHQGYAKALEDTKDRVKVISLVDGGEVKEG
jgi:hypothetical protein